MDGCALRTDGGIKLEALAEKSRPHHDKIEILRAETEEHLAAVKYIRRQVFVEEQKLFPDTDEDVFDRRSIYLLALKGKEAVGTVRLFPAYKQVWVGGRLAVLPQARGAIGKLLVNRAVQLASELGARRFIAHIQEQNLPFFSRLGWVPISSPRLYKGYPHLWMEFPMTEAQFGVEGNSSLLRPAPAPGLSALSDPDQEVDLAQLVAKLKSSPAWRRKAAIGEIASIFSSDSHQFLAGISTLANALVLGMGDDAAYIPWGESFLLLAADGIQQGVTVDPWWAGYCSILVNVNDIYAMGGRPLACVNIMQGGDGQARIVMAKGMQVASRKFGVPVVGGHLHPEGELSVAVAILGSVRQENLIPDNAARPADSLIVAIDLEGRFRSDFPHWDSTSFKEPQAIQNRLQAIAKLGAWRPVANFQRPVHAAKDISNPGILGTLGMLLEHSGCGAVIQLERIPRPAGCPWLKWLTSYPGCGFVLAVAPWATPGVLNQLRGAGFSAEVVGTVTSNSQVILKYGAQKTLVWDWRQESWVGHAARPGQQ